MIAALILATSAPATLPPLYYEAAYLSGRCRAYMLPVIASVEETVNSDPGLRAMYDDGIRDSERQPMRGDVCETVMRKIKRDMINLNRQANQSVNAPGTGKR